MATLQELKALAYDYLAKIQMLNSELQNINNLIAQKSAEQSEEEEQKADQSEPKKKK